MPAVSQAQQALMGQAYAIKKGDIKPSDLNPQYKDQIMDLADGMTLKQLEDYAKTPKKDLPKKVIKEMSSHIPSFDEFLSESDSYQELHEAAVDKYYTILWNKQNEKETYDHRMKILNSAEKAIPVLAETLERLFPDKFDLENIGFAFRGSSAFLYANVINAHDKFEMDSDGIDEELRKRGEFSKYFDIGGLNVSGDGSMKLYSHHFRLKMIH